MGAQAQIRLFVEQVLEKGAKIALSPEQSHYLMNVMRAQAGREIFLFDGQSGEWRAKLLDAKKKNATAEIIEISRPFKELADITLAFAPIKRMHTDFIAQKATELGARVLQPVMTSRTVAERVNTQRLRAHAIEAAEQCGLVSVPQINEPMALDKYIASCEARADKENLRLMFCDETGMARPARAMLEEESNAKAIPWIILVGPEGGFAEPERERLQQLSFSRPVSLGPRIMRADTAAIAALTLWQAYLGDFSEALAK